MDESRLESIRERRRQALRDHNDATAKVQADMQSQHAGLLIELEDAKQLAEAWKREAASFKKAAQVLKRENERLVSSSERHRKLAASTDKSVESLQHYTVLTEKLQAIALAPHTS